MKRYMTPKTRAYKGGSVDDNPVEVMEDIRRDDVEFPDGIPDDIMARIEDHMAGKGTTKTLRQVMQELGIEEDDETT